MLEKKKSKELILACSENNAIFNKVMHLKKNKKKYSEMLKLVECIYIEETVSVRSGSG
jgi:hypothetical protein